MARKNVLIVDDVAEIGRMLQAALATLSDQMVVHVVPSAEEGLLEATHGPIDLIISDIRLPGISGIELTRRVRQRHKAAKVIQISGVDDPTLQQQSIEAGADFFFRKPLSMAEFLSAVDRLLDLKKTTPLLTGTKTPATGLPRRLQEQIGELKQVLNAQAAGLVDDQGHILIQEGSLESSAKGPDSLGVLMKAIGAGQKLPQALGQTDTEVTLAFSGSQIDLLATSLSSSVALVIALRHSPTRVAMAIAFDEITRARGNLLGLLREKSFTSGVRRHSGKTGMLDMRSGQEAFQLHVPPAEAPREPVSPLVEAPTGQDRLPEKPEPGSDVTPDQKMADDLQGQEGADEVADSFWEKAVDHPTVPKPSRPNTLSYDQAREMGLIPSDRGKLL